MKMRICVECEEQFDVDSPAKRRVGGLKTHCSECSVETTVKYAGVNGADGKMASTQILKFDSQQDREKYLAYWRASSGMNTGKNCSLGFRASEPNISRKVVLTQISNPNHKGKSE
jgi:hypothetical protein